MINFQDEIARFKPSLEVEKIENAITATDLTDMNDLMMDIIRSGAETGQKRAQAARRDDAVRRDDTVRREDTGRRDDMTRRDDTAGDGL